MGLHRNAADGLAEQPSKLPSFYAPPVSIPRSQASGKLRMAAGACLEFFSRSRRCDYALLKVGNRDCLVLARTALMAATKAPSQRRESRRAMTIPRPQSFPIEENSRGRPSP
jgi:hypothetical protein